MMKRGDSRGEIYRQRIEGRQLCVCFVTVGELLFGAYKNKWNTEKLEHLKERLRSVVIVPFDFAVCQTYAELKTKLQSSGRSVADNDLWIAACAVRHSIALVSNNRTHFEGIPGLILISEAPVIREIRSQGSILEASPSPEKTESPVPKSVPPKGEQV
jgi:predicted nucleic acid-binding protein